MTQSEGIAVLQSKLDKLPPKKKVLIEDDGSEFKLGQLWSFKPAIVPTVLLLVVRVHDKDTADVVPVFHWGELAWDACFVLPAAYAGCDLHVATDMQSTVKRQALEQCISRMGIKGIRFVAMAFTPAYKLDYSWGIGLTGKHDHRLVFINKIAAALEAVQRDLRKEIYGKEG